MNSLRIDGAVVFWTLGEYSSRLKIEAGLQGISLMGGAWDKLSPGERTPSACLRDAVGKSYPKHHITHLAKRDGWAVMEESRSSDDVAASTIASFRVDEATHQIQMLRGFNYQKLMEIQSEYQAQRLLLKPAQVGNSLVRMLFRLNATTIRPTGGIYWLPNDSLPAWAEISKVIESAGVGGKNSMYRITHQFDADAIRAVRDAILAEVQYETDLLIEEIDSGTLGERALQSKAKAAEVLHVKIKEYENILGEKLKLAREMAEKAEQSAIAARLIATGAAQQ